MTDAPTKEKLTSSHDLRSFDRPGYDDLWGWFGLSYASWITIPRVMAHAMPDDWQARMFQLLTEFDEAFPGKHANDMPSPIVCAKLGRRFTKWPAWLLNYRYPDHEEIERLRTQQ